MNMQLRHGLLLSIAIILITLAPTAWAERGTTPQTIAGLGTVTFPTSAKSDAAQNPQNPGAAHYWIHGMDDPQHVAGALLAARALSKIAPDAGHAQHMTSHIFMALGMWDDVVTANENATCVVYAHEKAAGKPQVHCFHYNEWLEYAYFQQGRQHDAEDLLQACQRAGAAALQGMDAQQATAFRGSFCGR